MLLYTVFTSRYCPGVFFKLNIFDFWGNLWSVLKAWVTVKDNEERTFIINKRINK